MKAFSEKRRRWSMETQEALVVPLFQRIFHARVESKDLKDPEWDREGIDKVVRRSDGRSVLVAVRSRTRGKDHHYQRRIPLNVTIRSLTPGGSTEINKLNAGYGFYGVTDAAEGWDDPARVFLWWVLYKMYRLREAIESGRIAPGGDLYEKYGFRAREHDNDDNLTGWVDIPVELLFEIGAVVALQPANGPLEEFDKSADIYGAFFQFRLDDFNEPA